MRKSLTLTLSVMMALSMFTAIVSAQESSGRASQDPIAESFNLKTGEVVTTVNLSESVAGKLSQKALESIADQAGGGVITIHNIIPAVPIETNITTRAWWDVSVDWTIVKSSITHDNADPAQQIISVARGAEKKLTTSTTKKTTRTSGFEGGVSVPSGASAKLNASVAQEISKTYTTEQIWKGPSEGSSYSSRIFYYTGFKDYGKFSITGEGWPSGDTYGPYKGSYTEPTYYIEWSRDIN